MTLHETTTWRQIQQKDIVAFESYYKENYKAFFLMAFKYLKDPGLSEEVVNDIFVKLWEDGEKINIESSLKSYIYRSIINRSLNLLNKQVRDRQNQKEWTAIQDEAVELRHMEETELKARLYKAIDQLPDQCRKVFMMSRFEQLKQQEIADRLGISIKTVKNHITLALKRLSEEIGKNDLGIALIIIAKEIFLINN
jgi:RNA polymerase sigma-70 factor (ECF subfamily)